MDLCGSSVAGQAAVWAEALHPDLGTQVHARYCSGAFSGAAALTEHALGAGRVFYLGWYASFAQLEHWLRQWATELALNVLNLPDGVLVGQRQGAWVVLNFNETVRTVMLDGQPIEVAGCGVKKLAQRS